ncbi:MAG: CPBP family intramembrane glutamic endopeptidase [Candidatus Nanopelagicales bacterium]
MNIRTSPLVQMADEAKRPTSWWLAWIVGAVMIVGGSIAGDAVGSLLLGNPGHADTLFQFKEFFIFGVTLLLLFLWLRFKEGRPFSSVGFRGSNPVGKLALGFLVGAVMMTVGVLVPWALGAYKSGASEHTNVGSSALVAVIPLLLVFLWQASTEEAVTRGYMLQMAGRQIPGWAAILGTSVFFSVIHMDFRPIVLLNIALYAVFASFIALGQGNLWLIAGIHAGWNYFQGNIYGLPVSGNTEASSLFAIGPASGSSDLMTGGDFGVEASIVGTVILLIACAIGYTYLRRANRTRTITLDAATSSANLAA